MARHNVVGEIGEDIAVEYLKGKGYVLVTRNYRKKWGEIDIVAKRGNQTHFVEVKTISRENRGSVSQIQEGGVYKPEDNMHPKKLERLHRAIQSYIGEHTDITNWQLDLVTVVLYQKDKKAECRLLENVF